MVKAGRVVGDAISDQCVKTDPVWEIAARPPSRRIQGGGLVPISTRHPICEPLTLAFRLEARLSIKALSCR
jgi:hypothetical protein